MNQNNMLKSILTKDKNIKDNVSKIIEATPSYNRFSRNKILSKTARAIKSPYFSKYRELKKLCRMILLREKIKYDNGSSKIYGILFDGAWLWEEYIATILTKKGFTHTENKTGKNGIKPFVNDNIKFYPDFYKQVTNNTEQNNCTKASCIIDTKYKNFDGKNPQAQDLHQIISYIHVMDATSGIFVYPSTNSSNANIAKWELQPFKKSETVGTISFAIPKDCNDYATFKTSIKEAEKNFKKIKF